MPRSNRPRNSRREDDDEGDGLERLLTGWRRVEHRGNGDWNVQPIAAAQATKEYVCPGCSQTISPGTAHLVAWRADGLFGEADDVAARRHWHTHCWRITPL